MYKPLDDWVMWKSKKAAMQFWARLSAVMMMFGVVGHSATCRSDPV